MRDDPARDERGRLLPGHTANPGGRPPSRRIARLLEAAQACGVAVLLLPPVKGKAADLVDDLPPVPPVAA